MTNYLLCDEIFDGVEILEHSRKGAIFEKDYICAVIDDYYVEDDIMYMTLIDRYDTDQELVFRFKNFQYKILTELPKYIDEEIFPTVEMPKFRRHFLLKIEDEINQEITNIVTKK